MKKIFFLSAIACLLIISSCSKDDEGPSFRELLTSPEGGWDMTSVTGDPTGEYDEIVELYITFYASGTYDVYLEYDDGSDEDDFGEWELNGNSLILDDDFELTILEITTLTARLKDDEADATLNFEAD